MPQVASPAGEYALALGSVSLSLLVRWLLGHSLGDRIPFSLTLGVLLPLSLVVRPGPFLAAVFLGWTGALFLFVPPARSLRVATPEDALLMALYAGVLVLGVAAARLSHRVASARAREAQRTTRVERGHRESEDRLRLLADAVPVLISYIGDDLRYQFNNRQYEEWFGHARETLRGRHMREVLGDEAFERLRPRVEAALAGRSVEFEAEVPYRYGGPRFIHAHYIPDMREDGTVAGMYVLVRDTTSTRRAEAQLRYHSLQFQTLLEQAPLGVLLVDPDFRLVQVNPAGMPAFSGIPDLLGRDVDEVVRILWPQDRAEEIIGVFRRALETGERCHMPELEEVRADRGVVEYYDWRVDRITLPDGRFGAVCYFREISDQVRARQAIAASEARYRSLFESIDEAFCVLEVIFDDGGKAVDFRYVETNPAFEQQTGLHDALGKRASEVLQHEQHWFDVYGAVVQTGEPVRFQNRAQALGRWFDVYAFRMGALQERRVAVLFRDITGRRKAEEAIQFQARLLDQIGQAVIVTDPVGIIIYWNRAAEELYGWAREEAIGRHIMETTVGPRVEEASGIMERVRAGESWSGEFEVQCKDGTKTALVTNTPMFDEYGTLTAIIGISVDISELKTVQSALEAADRRKDEFLATLAHELRNPLAAIRMALGVLGASDADPAQLNRMKAIIDRQSAQLVRLIDDLLDVSRITRGQVELRKEPVDLAEVIDHAVDGVAGLCETKGIRLSVTPPAQPLMIEADALRFAQVVSNLLNNACKFTDEGGQISVTARRDRGDAVVRVRDTGVGIPRGELGRVFEMFAQVKGADGGSGGGLGIGLSLAQSIVALHGGSIHAHSDGPGQGSEFVVRVPALAPAGGTTPVADPGDVAPLAAPAGVRVLAVDDNRDALEAVAMMLQMAGYSVETASFGSEAVAKAHDYQPRAVLLDIGLPDIDGYEVARRIRQEPWGRDARLVAMTGWGQEKDKRQALEAGFDAHLTKPVDAEELVRVLRE